MSRIYKRGPLKWPKLLQVDPGREFMGAVSQLLARHNVEVRRDRVGDHRDQGIVERWNRTLSERLFGHQYAQEMRLPVGGRSTEWVRRLPAVVSALNGEVTRLTGKRPSEAIRAKSVSGELSSTVPGRPVGLQEKKLPSGVGVRFLYQPGELEGGRRRVTDPVWSLQVYRLGRTVTKPGELVLYYLDSAGQGPTRCIPRLGARHIHLSFSRQLFCFQRCAEGAHVGSRTCRINLHAQPCPYRRPPSRSRGGGCRCRCREAGTGLRTGSSAARSKSRT